MARGSHQQPVGQQPAALAGSFEKTPLAISSQGSRHPLPDGCQVASPKRQQPGGGKPKGSQVAARRWPAIPRCGQVAAQVAKRAEWLGSGYVSLASDHDDHHAHKQWPDQFCLGECSQCKDDSAESLLELVTRLSWSFGAQLRGPRTECWEKMTLLLEPKMPCTLHGSEPFGLVN